MMDGPYVPWMHQAGFDLDHARVAIQEEHFEWASFAALQAAEKACRALHIALKNQTRAFELTLLLEALPPERQVPNDVMKHGKALEKHYLNARYPTMFADGTPADHYTIRDAEQAIADAEGIIEFCYESLPEGARL